MDKELKCIISAVSKHFCVPKKEIVKGTSRIATIGRAFVCHLIRNNFPHLIVSFAEMSGMEKRSIYDSSKRIENRMADDVDLLDRMNEIREGLKLIKKKDCKKENERIKPTSNTKLLFGFDYTVEQRLKHRLAMRNAAIYMKSVCSCGRQPLEEGCVFTKKTF